MKKIILALLTAVIIVSCMALVSLHNEGEQDVTAYAAGSAKVCGVLSYEYSDGNGGILTAPLRNVKVVLWDKNEPIIYVKSVNNQGMPSMRVLYFEERNATPSNSLKNAPKTHECTCGDKFATKEQLNALEGKINDILAMYEELKDKQTQKTTKSAKKEVE